MDRDVRIEDDTEHCCCVTDGTLHYVCRMSYVVCRMSYVVCRVSCVVCRVSYVVCRDNTEGVSV